MATCLSNGQKLLIIYPTLTVEICKGGNKLLALWQLLHEQDFLVLSNSIQQTNKNAFQWDAYHPLVDRLPACTGQGVSVHGVCVWQTPSRNQWQTPPPWTDRHL